MKIQYKLLLMLILAFGMVIFSEQDCFAIVESKENIPKDIPYYSDFYDLLPDNQNYFIAVLDNPSWDNVFYFFGYTTNENARAILQDFRDNLEINFKTFNTSLMGSSFSSFSNLHFFNAAFYEMHVRAYRKTGDLSFTKNPSLSDGLIGFDLSNGSSILYTTNPVYSILKENNQVLSIYQEGQTTEPVKPEPDVDKLNLYELNLTDLDYNNQVHQFNLAMYTNSVCYDDVMNRYNSDCPYAIFVTDYTRVLTYDSESNMSLQRGAYLLSGYIDYLITDKSFFYYSNHYNRFMTRSGTFLESGFHSYKERYYFNAVYSEDTNDPDYIVWGGLNNGELVYTDFLDDFDYAYFVGSNQTIYYAEEKNNGKFKGLTNDIRKLGYLNRKEGGNVLDTSLMDERSYYIHNFNFSGGVVHNLYLNSPTYGKDSQDLLNKITITDNKYGVKQDGSNGNSYTSSEDIRDSQFNQGDVTDDTTNEEAKKQTGNNFGALDNKDLDDSNWGVLDYLSYWFNQDKDNNKEISGTVNSAVDTVTDKFSFKDNLISNANEIRDFIVNTQATHKYYLNINHKYLSGNICIIDLSWYEPYKPTVDAFICAFAYLAFMWHMFKILPSLISGASAGSYVSEISTYSHTGDGRSANIHNRKV